MTVTTAPTVDLRSNGRAATTPAPTTTSPSKVSDLGRRAAGLGALTFAGVVVAQNALRAGAPQPGADTDEIVTWFADHRAVTVALVGTFVVALAGLATFLGGTLKQLFDSGRRGWAILGWVGAGSIIATFAAVLASEQAISVVSTGSDPDPGAVSALWALHNSVFSVNLMFIAMALVGLTRATIAAGMTPRAFRWLAPVGAGLLAVGTIAGPYIAAGDAMPLFGISVLGFVVWLAFLVTTGIRLVRGERS